MQRLNNFGKNYMSSLIVRIRLSLHKCKAGRMHMLLLCLCIQYVVGDIMGAYVPLATESTRFRVALYPVLRLPILEPIMSDLVYAMFR